MKLFLTPSSPKKKISLNYALHHRGHYNLSFNFHLALITKQPKTLFKIAMLCHRTICIYVDAKLRNFWRQFRALNFLTLSLPMNCARPRIKPVFHLRGQRRVFPVQLAKHAKRISYDFLSYYIRIFILK